MRKFRKSHFLLQLPLFYFGRQHKTKLALSWNNENRNYRLTCNAKQGIPGARELAIYNCLLYLKQYQSQFTNGDLLKLLGQQQNARAFATYIKQGLEKLVEVKYTFTNCLELDKKITTAIIYLHKKGKGRGTHYEFSFPKVINEHLEQKGKYQLINLDAFLELPTGLCRRLYELLEKKKNQCRKGIFFTTEKQICQWLPIHGQYTSDRIRTLQKATNVLVENSYLASDSVIATQCRFVFATRKNAVKKVPQDTMWIKSIAEDFDETCLQQFSKQHLDEYLPVLKEKIQQINLDKITNKSGWILQAIREKWQPKIDVKKQVQQKANIEAQQQFEQIQNERYQREQQQKQNAIAQDKVRQHIPEIQQQINAQELWQQALLKTQSAPKTAQLRLAKFHFCDEIAKIANFDSELLDFAFCDYLVSTLYRGDLS